MEFIEGKTYSPADEIVRNKYKELKLLINENEEMNNNINWEHTCQLLSFLA